MRLLRQRRLRRRAARIARDDFTATVEQREGRAVLRAGASLVALRKPVETDEQRHRTLDQTLIVDQRHGSHDAPAAEPAADDEIAHHEAVARHDVAEPHAIVDLDDLRHRPGCARDDALRVHHQRTFVLIQSADSSLQSTATGEAGAGTHVRLRAKAGEDFAGRGDHVDLFARGELRRLREVLLDDPHAAAVAGDRLQHREGARREHRDADDHHEPRTQTGIASEPGARCQCGLERLQMSPAASILQPLTGSGRDRR